jgi:hypothetical protein
MERRQVVVSENDDGSLDLIVGRTAGDAATDAMRGEFRAARHRLGDDRPRRPVDTAADIAWRLPDTPFLDAQRWLELFVVLHERGGIDAFAAALRHLMPSTLAYDGGPARTTALIETLLAALQRPATPTPAQEASAGGATPPADADPDDTPRCEVFGADLPSLTALTARRSSFETVPEAVASILDAMADSDAACRALGGISRQRLSQRINAGEVLAVRRGKRAWRLPREQFRDGAVLPGVAEVIARRGRGWPAWRLLTTPHPVLAGETGFARLAQGDVVSVLKLANMLEGRIL